MYGTMSNAGSNEVWQREVALHLRARTEKRPNVVTLTIYGSASSAEPRWRACRIRDTYPPEQRCLPLRAG
jgi:hypothetical protein